jgi:hypothetical protein
VCVCVYIYSNLGKIRLTQGSWKPKHYVSLHIYYAKLTLNDKIIFESRSHFRYIGKEYANKWKIFICKWREILAEYHKLERSIEMLTGNRYVYSTHFSNNMTCTRKYFFLFFALDCLWNRSFAATIKTPYIKLNSEGNEHALTFIPHVLKSFYITFKQQGLLSRLFHRVFSWSFINSDISLAPYISW